jgi:DNA repair exonuclease SbcCD ATPase subunit
MNKFQDWTNGTSDINKYNKALEDSEQKVSDNNSQMEEYQNELSQNKDKLEELQKLQNNGTITEAQKTEIDNLKYQNALLEEKLQKLKDINEQETKNQAHDAADRFNTEFNEGNDKNQSTNANDVIERVKKTYSNTSPDGESTGINWNAALNGNENDVGVQQLAKIKLATDEYNQAVHDLVNGVNDVTEEDVENYKYTLDTLTENFEGNKEKLYNDLTDGIKKMEAVKGTDDFDQKTYDNMQSWLEIFLNYIGEYKKAQETVGLTLTQTINRFKSSEESSLDELKQSYQDAIDKRNELYSGENYVGNVDINNRPVVINDDGSYSTTSTAFQEKWVGDEENGHYIIAHFTPILPDGTVLDEDSLNEYIDKILNSDDPMEADKVENGGKGIVYKVDTEINGKEINDGNLEDAFGIADAWDVDMHNLQDKMYANEAEIKSQIENFEGGIDGSQTIKNFFDTEGINTQSLINKFNEVTDGITNADEAIQKWNEHKKEIDNTPKYSEDFQTLNDSLSSLTEHAELLSKVNKEISESGRISAENLKKINEAFPEDKYPELTKSLYEYQLGLISTTELFDKLEECYNSDVESYKQKNQEEIKSSEYFWNKVITGNEELQVALTNFYGEDWKKWTNLEQAKAQSEQKLIENLGGMWAKYFKNQLAAFKLTKDAEGYVSVTDNDSNLTRLQAGQKFGELTGNNFSAGSSLEIKGNANVEAERQKMAKLQHYIDDYNEAIRKMNESVDSIDIPDFTPDLSWSGLGDDDSSSGSDSSSSSEPSPQDFNWVERLLSKISKAYNRLKNKVADTTRTWLNRNNALSDSMETLLSEINAQSDAYDFYMDRFNSYDLDGYYKDQIANGSFNIETVYDEDLKDAISDCQDLYDKAQDAADSVQSLNIEIRQLAKSRFDNIQSQFEEVLGKVNSIKDLYSKDNDLLEEQGWFASTLLNNSMMEQEQKNLTKLEQERDALTKALNSAIASGKIEAESEDWYSMQSAIDDCTSSIYDAKKALVEYDNAIRQINWDAFDRTRDDVSNLIDETQFLVDLLKDEDITDDNGNMNDNGKAAQALIAQKYQLYLNQAKAYKDEILKINEELTNDPYDKELLDRKQELIKAQQEAINSSISEKDALKDLVQEGYDTFLDKLDEVIQKYKDLMNQQKDAYDYEKSIAEKTKALNALEKQYSAVQGDNSEEGKKNIQQLKDQINTAKDDLKDTEYEKLISDTQAILDNLADTTKTWLDERLDSFDITMQEIIDQSNENASNISQTITDTAENYGYKLSESMSNIWSTNASNITNGINSVLGDFSNKFVEGNNAINKVCGDINAAVQGLLKNSNDEAQRVADEIARQQAEQNANTDGGYSDGGGSSDSGDDWSDNWDNSDSGSSNNGGSDGVNWIYSPDDFPKDELDISSSIVDRIKWHDYDSSFSARAGYYEQMGNDDPYYGTSEQNIQMLEYMKSHGLKKGSKSAHGGLTLTDEDGLGSEVIFSKKYGTLRKLDAGDMVFNADQVEKLWNLSKGITTPNMYMDNLGVKLPDVPNISNNLANKVDVEFGDVTLSLPNVKNYEDFMKQMVSDKRFLKAVQEGTLGQVLGRNSLNMLTFR